VSGRPWPAYVAGALLLGLMLIAYLARGSSTARQMWLTPARAAAGESVSVRYQEPRTTFGVSPRLRADPGMLNPPSRAA